MFDKLLELHINSYVPISNFPVSACVITKDGQEYYGVNVEDASTRAGTCAERAAIFAAITDGCKPGDFKELNVMVSSGKVGTPCFVCRQMISELFDEDAIIRCHSIYGDCKEYKAKELCPYPFGEEDLK